MRDTTEAKAQIQGWLYDPVKFVVEVMRAEPDAWQLDVLRAYQDPEKQRIAMKACKGPGKTTVLAWMAWHFLSTRPHPKIAATSISADNLADNLWPEMAKWQTRHDYLKTCFHWTKTRIFSRDHPETWFMSARSWSKQADSSQQADTLAGLHAEYLMFILDESGGIPDSVAAAAEAGLATGFETRLIQAGNPTHLEGPLYRACTNERHLWWLIEITSDPDDPKRTPRVKQQWAREQIEKYGRENPWVLTNVFGKFPPASINSLLGPDEVSAAMKRRVDTDKYEFSQKRLGIDVARFGDDRTVIFPRQGLIAFKPVEMRNARSHEIAARVAMAKQKWGSELEAVDGTGGFGAGVIDALHQAGHAPLEIHFSGKAIDSRYLNKRAEMYFLMADWVKKGGALPQDPELSRELTAATYMFKNGKFQIEDKDQIKDRLSFSPDKADALALTFCLPDMPARDMMLEKFGAGRYGKLQSDYDPFNDNHLQNH